MGATRYLRGWLGYFGKCETPSVLARLGQWFRRQTSVCDLEAGDRFAESDACFDSLGIPRLTVKPIV
jgi:hypothetical protein